MRFVYNVILEAPHSGFEVTADQRDVAEFECQPFGEPFYSLRAKPFTAVRWLAWHAAKRRKLTTLSWDEFKDACVEVEDITPEDETDADPTQRAASAEPSSK